MNPNSDKDQADFLLLRQGDELVLNRLMTSWERRLFAFAWRYLQNGTDAQDVVVETFVRLHQQRLRLRPDTNLAAWFFTTLQNLCHNRHRWHRRHPTVSLDVFDEGHGGVGEAVAAVTTRAPEPNKVVEHDEEMQALATAIDQLPHELKATLLLYYYEGLSYRDVGGITGCSERGVETRLYRARLLLRQALAETLHEPAGS